MRVLLVEDDAQLTEKIIRFFAPTGISVETARDGETAIFLGENSACDCAVLDLGLPSLDGVAVLKHWRKVGLVFPVIVLTAREAWADKARSFRAGADDYLTKPFLPDELIVRVQALVRRSRGQVAERLACGNLTFEPHSGGFYLDDNPLRLTGFEAKILTMLFQFHGQPVERVKLFESLYDFDTEAPTNSLEVLIGRLRKKIGVGRIETVRGYGYRLTAGDT